mmetsp:Transcript_120653/g.196327  ORF Transcript_120653/g.196327 Transcript_120653/m.196327 type:complete len:241 (-) Transcript_120653:78-800(-)
MSTPKVTLSARLLSGMTMHEDVDPQCSLQDAISRLAVAVPVDCLHILRLFHRSSAEELGKSDDTRRVCDVAEGDAIEVDAVVCFSVAQCMKALLDMKLGMSVLLRLPTVAACLGPDQVDELAWELLSCMQRYLYTGESIRAAQALGCISITEAHIARLEDLLEEGADNLPLHVASKRALERRLSTDVDHCRRMAAARALGNFGGCSGPAIEDDNWLRGRYSTCLWHEAPVQIRGLHCFNL